MCIIRTQKKREQQYVILSFMWCHQESNRGHKDFQSFALPTELWHLIKFALRYILSYPQLRCKDSDLFSTTKFFRNKSRKMFYYSTPAYAFTLPEYYFVFSEQSTKLNCQTQTASGWQDCS